MVNLMNSHQHGRYMYMCSEAYEECSKLSYFCGFTQLYFCIKSSKNIDRINPVLPVLYEVVFVQQTLPTTLQVRCHLCLTQISITAP